ncbi:unnamed protein product [Rotaria socialis]|uniref:Uncharacterized protein n=1 Tax=Rotaria socialis TaxID=392032 RepID=A0A818D4U0_9BILA|nr:unnamed protein product [Rotaria socialis]CAF3324136.1 unnamed protein product [Rotaria socialis]CAF3416650.1 unnamed protein product [Rotaria socialis]CAF3437818.1 unnamed protein product [Rotaria socialis]CAF3653637.1 unnamed protein product [Rotaria socialis]
MFSSRACSALHTHQKLSPCRWSTSGPSLVGERGDTTIDVVERSPFQAYTYKKAHPRRHLVCAIFATLLFFVTGVVAVFYAAKSLHCERKEYFEQALIYSRRSLSWSLATYVIALFIYLALGLVIFIRNIDPH